jgi:hypothetical protein
MEWTPKPPGDTRLYSYDLEEIAPDTILTAVFARTAGTVTLTAVDPDERTAYVLVAGGANGETASLSLTVTTSQGQTFVRTVSLDITTGADEISPISTITKGTIVIRALGKLGIANYVFDTEAEEDVSALRQLDSLAANWQGKLRPFGYLQPATNGTSSPSDSAGIDEADVDAFIYNLAEALAGDYGKTPAPGVLKRAADTRSELFCRYQIMAEYRMPSRVATGAGNDRGTSRRFFCGG